MSLAIYNKDIGRVGGWEGGPSMGSELGIPHRKVVPNFTQKWIQIHIVWRDMLTLCISMDKVGMFKQEYT